jgi:hypothetical protein
MDANYVQVPLIKANGTLVWTVSAGGAVRRYESRYFSRKIVPADRPNVCQAIAGPGKSAELLMSR